MVAHMFRALKMQHVCRIDEILCLLRVPTAYQRTPMRAVIMTPWLQDVLLVLEILIHRPADVTNGNGENPFPPGTLVAGSGPSLLDRVRDASSTEFMVVRVPGGDV